MPETLETLSAEDALKLVLAQLPEGAAVKDIKGQIESLLTREEYQGLQELFPLHHAYRDCRIVSDGIDTLRLGGTMALGSDNRMRILHHKYITSQAARVKKGIPQRHRRMLQQLGKEIKYDLR